MEAQWTNQAETEKQIREIVDGVVKDVRSVMQEAAEEVAEFILFRGAEDIQDAGNFGDRWVDAFHADVSGTARTVDIDVSMKPDGPPVIYWKVFEYGATIFAKNPTGLLTFRNTAGYEIDGEVPEFISVPQVTIPKKFHLHEIARSEAAKAGDVFSRLLSER